MQRPFRWSERLAQTLIRRFVAIIAADVMQQRRELRIRLLVDAAVLLEAVTYAGAKLVDRPFRTGYADDGHIEQPTAHQRVQRRVELFVREIARRAEQHECV